MKKTCHCPVHGTQGIGLVCVHIAHAVDSGEKVGFFWGSDDDLARPDAWCKVCEDLLVAALDGEQEQWFRGADFKVFCASCWDQARQVCGGPAV
jgi:hypothetical protein